MLFLFWRSEQAKWKCYSEVENRIFLDFTGKLIVDKQSRRSQNGRHNFFRSAISYLVINTFHKQKTLMEKKKASNGNYNISKHHYSLKPNHFFSYFAQKNDNYIVTFNVLANTGTDGCDSYTQLFSRQSR